MDTIRQNNAKDELSALRTKNIQMETKIVKLEMIINDLKLELALVQKVINAGSAA